MKYQNSPQSSSPLCNVKYQEGKYSVHLSRFSCHKIWINAHCIFLLGTSHCTVGNCFVGSFDTSFKEITYVAAVEDGWRQWVLLFVTVATPGSLEVWAFPHMTRLGPLSALVVNMQPCARVKDINVSQTPTPLPSRGNQIPGWHKYTGRFFQPSVVSTLIVWS